VGIAFLVLRFFVCREVRIWELREMMMAIFELICDRCT
jgi:hypothetical protein